ncbi:MAG TPA: lmo0937 family membrane protein [Gemmatimonadaceae bacterium]
MLLIFGCVLLVLWLLGFVLLKKTVGALIHIVLIIALIVIVIHFLRGQGVS